MTTSQSIYARATSSGLARTRTARAAQRARTQQRRAAVLAEGPPRRLDRMTPILELLRAFRETGGAPEVEARMRRYLAALDAEVAALEAWARGRPASERSSGPVVRQALELLRVFGRMTALDFSAVPVEARGDLVHILALEHRWCYAAAGTTRATFKRATGRTGAR